MGLMRKSRLRIYKQDRLLEYFVAGTTARTASSLCGVNRKTAAFYFHRLREVIAFELDQEGLAMFAGEIEVDESYFGGARKGNVEGVLREKSLYLGYLNVAGRFIRRSFPMRLARR